MPPRSSSGSRRKKRSTRRGGGVRVRISTPSGLARYALTGLLAVLILGTAATAVSWIVVGRMIDKRLAGGPPEAPRLFARPFEVRERQALAPAELVARVAVSRCA